jgi:GT2 family glycosyltransferase
MPSGGDPRPRRVLLAVLVYNGQSFVPGCLESAAMVQSGRHDIDVLVLDDCSPDPGWSEDVEALCVRLGIGYYRSPRNLGIPRNMNLALLHGVAKGYDYVVILNSDVVLPRNLVDGMVPVAEYNDNVGTVTAWSNNASMFSLPNRDAARFVAPHEWTNWISNTMSMEFGPAGVEIPVGVGFCLMVPTSVVDDVGLFDPAYGRGYCEEVDFCLRCRSAGLRNLLAPNVFVYHQEGSGSARLAGLLREGETTVEAHERIVDWRYPLYRSQLTAYEASNIPDTLRRNGLNRILGQAAAEFGYVVEVGSVRRTGNENEVSFLLSPGGPRPLVTAFFRGFEIPVAVPASPGVLHGIRSLMGVPPRLVAINDRAQRGAALLQEAQAEGIAVMNRSRYPERV